MSKSMLRLLLVFTPIGFFVRMCVPYYALYANHVLQIGEFDWALLRFGYSIAYYVLLLPIGKLVDVFGRKTASTVFSGRYFRACVGNSKGKSSNANPIRVYGSTGEIRTFGFEGCEFWRALLPFLGGWVEGLDPIWVQFPSDPPRPCSYYE